MRFVAAMDYGRPLELGAKWSSCGYARERIELWLCTGTHRVAVMHWNACVMMVVMTVAMKLRDDGDDGGQLR